MEGGCTWGDVDHATHAFGMATPTGIISTTGVGGLTLGGGLGYLTRKCGLTIDNLLEADMVLADGSFVTVSAKQNQDLFWAIRGGGGNFGVVTSLLFRLYDVHTDYAGPMLWEAVPRFSPAPQRLTALEERFILGWSWWSPADLQSTEQTIYPPDLADLIRLAG